MVRWVALVLVLVAVLAANGERIRRQVTYHAKEHYELDKEEANQFIRPVTKKPLPARVVYPGDLSSFYTTDSPNNSRNNNLSSGTSFVEQDGVVQRINRRKRSAYHRRKAEDSRGHMRNPLRYGKSFKNKDVSPMESRLHSSYHKPSVSIMNDVPVEMSFDGAGFLRHEDDDFNDENSEHSKSRNSGSRSVKTSRDRNRALDDFRKVFNVSRERAPSPVKFDDDTSYQSETPPFQATVENVPDYGTQGAENGTPLAVDYMAAYQNAFQNPYQNGMFGNPQFNYAPSQPTQTNQAQPVDPFSFNYASMFGGQSNMNPMMPPTMHQDSFMQNHRIPQVSNPSAITPPAMYAPVPQQQAFATNPMFTQPTPNPQQNHKIQRRKRSILYKAQNGESDTATSASHLTKDHYRYSRVDDQQDASSGFIPITGNFNGGTIQLNFPFYGQNPISPPSYPPRPPIHSAYSVPGRSEGRNYGGSGERFYHPSEARRYSYGVLGSGNFEVIRGGLFPGERQQSYHGGGGGGGGGYQDGRIPYGGDEWSVNNNYGTTEIIIDGPIQGFQGFDNFQLINALSKHSEIAVRPDRSDSEEHAS